MKPILELHPETTGLLRVHRLAGARPEGRWHYHPAYELTWIQRGRGRRLVGDHQDDYAANDLVLVGPNIPHAWAWADAKRPQANAHRQMTVHFEAHVFPAELLALPEYGGLAWLLPRARRGVRFPASFARTIGPEFEALAEERNRLSAWTRLALLLNRLAACQATEALASESYQGTHGLQNHKRLARIVAYLQQHLRSDTPLENVARHAGMSPSAFSRFFHRMTGKTFVCYRNSCRVHEACRLLSETDHSITDIAFASGFENLANFNRQFLAQKKMTPHVYRRAYHPLSGTPPRKLRVAKTESLELNTA